MQKIKNLIILAVLTLSALFVVTPGLVYAAPKDDVSRGACLAAGRTDCDAAVAESRLENTVAGILNVLSIVIGVVAVIMIIIGGFRYVVSAGNEQSVAGAKRTILYAIVGLLVVALAQVIVQFVLVRTT